MKKVHKAFGTIIGIASVIEAIVLCGMKTGSYELSKSYGGDAYTGIQNASAQAANNIYHLAEIVKTGFSAVLLVFGLTMILLFATNMLGLKKKEVPVSYPAMQQGVPQMPQNNQYVQQNVPQMQQNTQYTPTQSSVTTEF